MVTYYFKLFFTTLIAFFAIDMVWLGLVARTFYRNYFGFLLTPTIKCIAAVLLYLLFIRGILAFVVVPGLQDNLLKATPVHTALIELVTTPHS